MNERFKFPADREARNAARTKALESLLIEKGVITGETVDKVLGVFETKMGPLRAPGSIPPSRNVPPRGLFCCQFDSTHDPPVICCVPAGR